MESVIHIIEILKLLVFFLLQKFTILDIVDGGGWGCDSFRTARVSYAIEFHLSFDISSFSHLHLPIVYLKQKKKVYKLNH